MKIRFPIVALILFTIIGTYEVQARCWQGYDCGALKMGGWDCFPGVDLSQEQIKSFNRLRASFIKDTTSINIKFFEKEMAFRILLLEPVPNPEKVAVIQKEIFDLQAEDAEVILSYQLKARNILTADQIKLLPAGCSFGFGNRFYGQGRGYGYDGPGAGFGRGRGYGRGRCW